MYITLCLIRVWFYIFLCVHSSVYLTLSLPVSLHSPDTPAQGCESSSDVSADIQKLTPDQEASKERSGSSEGGEVLSRYTDPGPDTHSPPLLVSPFAEIR